MNLSTTQSTKLAHYEATIKTGVKAFMLVGNALMAIRDEQLWKGEYSSFDDYCERRWKMSQWYAYKTIAAVEVANRLDNCPKLPESEAQVRPLTKVAKEKQADVWNEAVATSATGTPTAKEVEQVAVKHPKPKKVKSAVLFICQSCNTQYTDGTTECNCEEDTKQSFTDEPNLDEIAVTAFDAAPNKLSVLKACIDSLPPTSRMVVASWFDLPDTEGGAK